MARIRVVWPRNAAFFVVGKWEPPKYDFVLVAVWYSGGAALAARLFVGLMMAKKKELIQKGMMSRPRCYVGFFGVQRDTIHRFVTAFDGTIIRPQPTDVVKVKLQPTFHGDVQAVIDALSASNDSQFLKQVGNCLIFYKARYNENKAGSD